MRAGCSAALLAVLVVATPAFGADAGTLDTGFANGGIRPIALGTGDANLNAVVKLADGAIVGAGFAEEGGTTDNHRDVLVVKLTSGGALDPGFNAAGPTPGVLTFPVSAGTQRDLGNAIALGPGGTLYVAGETDPAGGGDSADIFVARVTGAGAVDTGFSADGLQTLSLGTFGDRAHKVAIQDDGKVVVAGGGGTAAGGMIVARLDGTTGAPDGSFGAGGPATGVQEIDFSASAFESDVARGLALLPGGAIAVAGTANQSSADDDFALARLTGAGVLDTASGFGGGTGMVRTTGGTREFATHLAVDGSGRLVVGGVSATGAVLDFHVARYSPLGVLDNGFAGDGTATTPFPASDGTRFAQATSVAIDGSGRIVASGSAFGCSAAGCADTAVARYTDSGTLDTELGGDGTVTHDLTGASRNDFSTGAVVGSITLVAFGFDGAREIAKVARLRSCCKAAENQNPTPHNRVPAPPPPPAAQPPASVPPVPFDVRFPGSGPNTSPGCDAEDLARERATFVRAVRGTQAKKKKRPRAAAAQAGGALKGKCVLPRTRGCPQLKGLLLGGNALDNTITGTRASDTLRGLGGADILRAGNDNDLLLPGPGADRIVLGEECNDVIFHGDTDTDVLWDAGTGNDILAGRAATMTAGAGDDLVDASDGGPSRINGGPGADVIDARNGKRDGIDCGAGDDAARVDRRDTYRNCERVRVR